MNKNSVLKILAVISLSGFLSACSSKTPVATRGEISTVVVRQPINELEREPVPGTVDDVWVEPMYDVTAIPAQLSPDGNTFRPAHNMIVEIRPGRFQKVQYPDEYDPNFKSQNQSGAVIEAPPAGQR